MRRGSRLLMGWVATAAALIGFNTVRVESQASGAVASPGASGSLTVILRDKHDEV